ncbi:MAG: molecular chaperone HtpG [Oscillospiraceae bacterium]|nr:molecular chaperone HtpG [Oscillospiraceae bacterium]
MAKKQFKAESKRLLGLMIDSIYTHKEIFLRELISNASDAIDKLCYQSLTEGNTGLDRSDFFIRVSADKDARTLTVSDNGLGMSDEDLDSNLGVIARSGSLSFKEGMDKEAAAGEDIDVIGQFGVGFYSAFMVAEKVEVVSKKYGSEAAWRWESSGADGYTIKPCEKEDRGTDIILTLKPDTEEEKYSEFLEDWRLRSLIKKYSDYVRYPIKMGEETVNSMVPIWQRSKAEASDEDCVKFYKEKFYDMDDPVKVIRVSAEGSVSYRALLFIPAKAPFNYYSRDYEAGLQLYSSGVLIMDKCTDLLPECFRFVRGVVDSPDLSLNISRELLQHDRQLKIIAANLEKRVKKELKDLMTDAPEQYDSFYKEFGLQLKYGLLNNYGEKRELLQDLLLFYSSTQEKAVSLKEYADAMPQEQKYIYYACGDSISRLAGLPQAEPVREKGWAILYLTDEVDEFVMNMLGTYEEKELKNVISADLGLGEEGEKEKLEAQEKANEDLLSFVKDTLEGAVSSVKLSGSLRSAPVCLGTQGEITLEMEKYFASIPGSGEKIKAERVLELNPSHPAFESLVRAWAGDQEKAAKYAKLLYYEALLYAGLSIPDPADFAGLVTELMV